MSQFGDNNINSNSNSNSNSNLTSSENESLNKNDTFSSTYNDQKISKLKIFVDNVEWSVHENLLKKFFSKFGKVKKCKIIRETNTGRSKGFGFVEFENETDLSKVFNATKDQLILNDREIKVDFYREKPKFKKKKPLNFKTKISASSPTTSISPFSPADNTTIVHNESQTNLQNTLNTTETLKQETFIQDLPFTVFSLVFSKLTIRDLCIVEQVCKRWHDIAGYVWRTKKKLILNHEHIFGDYVKKQTNNIWGFGSKNYFDFSGFKSIMKKGVGQQLKYLDLSEYSQNYGVTCLQMITDQCSHLTHLNISKLKTSNYNFVKLVKRCTKLKELKMAHCSQITDPSLSKLFQYCRDLEKLDITFCHMITGMCFLKSTNNLKCLIMDQCESISDENLLVLFSKNKNFTHLSMKRSNSFWNAILLSIINNMTKLEVLNLADTGFDVLNNVNIENIRFENMVSLVSLDLSNSSGDNQIIARLLQNSFTLKSLNLSYCFKLTDELFVNTKINCPLEELNLNFISQISDKTLKSLYQISNTLKILKLKGCQKITSEGISQVLIQLTNLTSLDVRSNMKIDNAILDTSLLLNRPIEIFCNDTNIDTVKFVYKYDGTVKELVDRNYFRFKYKNLTFESSLFEPTKFRKNSDQVKIWEEDGLYYIGSPLGTEDEDEDDYYSDMVNDDDNDDFFEDDNQNEMFDEMGQFKS